MKKIFFIIPAIMLIFAGCSDSSSPPSESGLYTYSHIEEEKIEVYGEGGKVVSKSNWNSDMKNSFSQFEAHFIKLKQMEFDMNDSNIVLHANGQTQVMNYKMKKDTIFVILNIFDSDTLGMNYAIKRDANTLVFYPYLVNYYDGEDSELSSGINLGGYQLSIDEYQSQISKLLQDEFLAFFLRKTYFKK